MSFISQRRLFTNAITPRMASGYIFDALAVVAAWGVVARSIPELRRFGIGASQVVADPASVAMIGFLGLYGVRISSYVAMARGNRAPQIVEWWCMLLGLIIPITVWMLDNVLLKAYASVHGYEFCHKMGSGGLADYLFVLRGRSCPPG